MLNPFRPTRPAVAILGCAAAAAVMTACNQPVRQPAFQNTPAGAALRSSAHALLPPRMSTTPEQLRPGCSERTLRRKLGPPTTESPWRPPGSANAIGKRLSYRDHWWIQGHRGAQGFASWSVFIDGAGKFAGWRLDSPTPQTPAAREVFFGTVKPVVDLGVDFRSLLSDGAIAVDRVRVDVGVPLQRWTGEHAPGRRFRDDRPDNELWIDDGEKLAAGDELRSLDGVTIDHQNTLLRVMADMRSGKTYRFVVARGGKFYRGSLKAKPAQPAVAKLGVEFRSLISSGDIKVDRIETRGGVPLLRWAGKGEPHGIGRWEDHGDMLDVGDSLRELGGVSVDHQNTLLRVMAGMRPGETYRFVVARKDSFYRGALRAR